jgi:hypothetical protein
MGHVLAQVTFQRTTLVAEDQIVNTFHFETLGAPDASDLDSIALRLQNFYRNPAGGTDDIQHWTSNVIIGGTLHTIKMYDMSQPIPRAPLRTSPLSFNPGGIGGITLPAEVALVLSLRAVRAPGVPASRARGRIYLGPFMGGAVGPGAAGDGRPNATLQTVMNNAAIGLRSTVLGPPRWSVYSRIDNVLRRVTGSSVDNAWDTQRRRGGDPTAKVSTNDI